MQAFDGAARSSATLQLPSLLVSGLEDLRKSKTTSPAMGAWIWGKHAGVSSSWGPFRVPQFESTGLGLATRRAPTHETVLSAPHAGCSQPPERRNRICLHVAAERTVLKLLYLLILSFMDRGCASAV
mmetsp:Transcript_145729/g.379010  ORF Transcript_145729/g.379010 Transcript_145729/m.379010 type:complete len:127 (+) Transcript_145729:562-942(+)